MGQQRRGEEVVLKWNSCDGRGRPPTSVAGFTGRAGWSPSQVHVPVIHHHHFHAAEGRPSRSRGGAAPAPGAAVGITRKAATLVLRAARSLLVATAAILPATLGLHTFPVLVSVGRRELGRDAVVIAVGTAARCTHFVPEPGLPAASAPQPHHHYTL